MESGLIVRKDIKLFQFMEQFPLKVKLFMLIKESYEEHMTNICKSVTPDLDVKIYKALQDVCTNYHEGIINEMNNLMNEEDYSKSCENCSNCKNDNFLNDEDEGFNIVEENKHSSDSNWPSSLSNNSQGSEGEDSYSFMPLSNYEK